MERVAASLKSKIMSAEEAAQLVKSGMSIGLSGFTSVGYPKAVPSALAASGHAKDLTILVGAAVGDDCDGALVRAGCVKKRFGHQTNKDLRTAINNGSVSFSDIHISHFPMNLNQQTLQGVDVAIVECVAITEDGLYLCASAGSTDAAVHNARFVIAEVNTSVPMGLMGMHDIFEVGIPPHARIINITDPRDRIGTPYVPCPPEKIAAIVMTDKLDPPQKFKPVTPATQKVGENVVKFLKDEIAAGRLPADPGPIQSGVGSVGNAVLSVLSASGFKGLTMYTEVMQDAAFSLIDQGVIDFVSASSIALAADSRERFFENIDQYRDKMVIRPQEISNHPEVIRRLGIIALNTPVEVDIYGNVNSTHQMGSKMLNGIGGSGDFARNGYLTFFFTNSTAKGGTISSVVPMCSHIDHTEHDTDVFITERGVADVRGLSPKERARVIIKNTAHPDYQPLLLDYLERAEKATGFAHTPHLLKEAFSFHTRFMETGTMKK